MYRNIYTRIPCILRLLFAYTATYTYKSYSISMYIHLRTHIYTLLITIISEVIQVYILQHTIYHNIQYNALYNIIILIFESCKDTADTYTLTD